MGLIALACIVCIDRIRMFECVDVTNDLVGFFANLRLIVYHCRGVFKHGLYLTINLRQILSTEFHMRLDLN